MDAIFAITGAIAIGGALVAICERTLMRGLLGLCATFLAIAILCWEMGAQYIAIAQILVFLGGVVALLVLSFSASPAPMQRGNFLAGASVALLTLVTIILSLSSVSGNSSTESTFPFLVTALFGPHAFSLHVALLMLLAGVLGSKYLLEESA